MHQVEQSFTNLKQYCEKNRFKGWDPYDGLNSLLFENSPLKYSKLFRLIQIQAFKRNPLNLRKLLLIPKGYNPKGLGLFLTAYCNLYQIEKKPEDLETIHFLAGKLIELQTKGFSGACWGYNFPWQSRAFYLERWAPTVVATGFIAYSLMDAFDTTGNKEYLRVALSSCEFVLKDLNRTPKENGFIFSYSPFDHTRVYNASLIGSRLLSRAYRHTPDPEWIKAARTSIQACADAQREDGAWVYGELGLQNWVDNFHTGYNLECIHEYQKYSGDSSFQPHIDLGLEYYFKHFFLEDGTPKYYDTKTYPIDVHCPAQLFVTLARLDILDPHMELAEKVMEWTIRNMQDERGYFYYQLKSGLSSRIPYIRWAQAWMMFGMSFFLKHIKVTR